MNELYSSWLFCVRTYIQHLILDEKQKTIMQYLIQNILHLIQFMF